MNKNKKILLKYLPSDTIDIIWEWIIKNNVNLKITKKRNTKTGDFRADRRNNIYKISINNDLNKYSFLITLVHEFAHLEVWKKYKNSVKPHGAEWKKTYKDLLSVFIDNGIFPDDIFSVLVKHIKNPKASSSSDIHLCRVLKKYDINDHSIFLEDLPPNSVFRLENGKTFKKQEKIKKRYKCICLNNNKKYLVNSIAKVLPV